MIRTVDITNFRCFKHVKIDNLAPVNLVVGDNASGKTALLEAIFLGLAQSPEIALRLRGWRQQDGIITSAAKDIFRDLFSDLFFGFDWSRGLSIQIDGKPQVRRSLNVVSVPETELSFSVGLSEPPTATVTAPIIFQWTHDGVPQDAIQPKFVDGRLIFNQPAIRPDTAHFFAVNQAGLTQQNVRYFSELSKRMQSHEVVYSMRKHFEFIDDLSIEIFAGQPSLAASIEHLSEKVPLSFVSHGPHRLVSLLLAMASAPASVLLVDEIENGFFHEKLERIWTTLITFARERNVQIVASTHSFECLEAAVHAVGDRLDDIQLLRARRSGLDCTVSQIAGEALAAAVRNDFEVR